MFKGSGVAIVTPFNPDLSVDYPTLETLLNWHVENQTDAIIITGTTGEATTLTYEEQLAVIAFAVKVIDKRIPVIAGTGSNNTMHMVKLSQEAEKLGVDGLLCVTPYYNKATQEGLYQHFSSVAKAVNIPIILYDVPARTQVTISVDTLVRLSVFDNIIGIKDATGDLDHNKAILEALPEFLVYTGNDDLIYDVLDNGGAGVISVVANIKPYDTHRLVWSYLEGDHKASKALQEKLNPLIDQLFIEPNPIAVKYALNTLNLIPNGSLRLPLTELSEKYHSALIEVIS